jgi:hypothetical protein
MPTCQSVIGSFEAPRESRLAISSVDRQIRIGIIIVVMFDQGSRDLDPSHDLGNDNIINILSCMFKGRRVKMIKIEGTLRGFFGYLGTSLPDVGDSCRP